MHTGLPICNRRQAQGVVRCGGRICYLLQSHAVTGFRLCRSEWHGHCNFLGARPGDRVLLSRDSLTVGQAKKTGKFGLGCREIGEGKAKTADQTHLRESFF